MSDVIKQSLRDLVAQRVDLRWTQWAQAHPHMAEAIDRARLVEVAVDRLADDAAFREAMRQADLDESQLGSLLRLLDIAEGWVSRLMPL